MNKLYFLQSEKPVKKFIISERTEEELLTSRGKILDEMAKISGKLIFEIKLREHAMLFVIEFDNEVLLSAWERLISPSVTLNEVKTCKVLVVQGEKICEKMARAVRLSHGKVLEIKRKTMLEHHILLYFSKKEDMKRFVQKYNIISN